MSQSTDPGSDQSPGAAIDANHEDGGRLHGASTGRLIAILVTLVLFAEFVPLQYTMVGVIIPKIGGVLTDHFSWKSIFWFLLIYAAATIPLLAVVVPESPLRTRQRFDVVGAILFGTGIGGVLI